MHEILEQLFYRFYTPLPMEEAKREVQECHQQLIQRLDKPERKLILRILDAQSRAAEEQMIDSFLCGFHLALELTNQLNHHQKNRLSNSDR